MKKGEIYEGIIEKVDFPNKGYVCIDDQKVLIKHRDEFLKFWRNLLLRQEMRCAITSRHVAAVCIRRCLMRTSW